MGPLQSNVGGNRRLVTKEAYLLTAVRLDVSIPLGGNGREVYHRYRRLDNILDTETRSEEDLVLREF